MKKETEFVDLGWVIGKIVKQSGYSHLYLVSPPDEADQNYVPASGVTIAGEDSIVALRDALLKMFPKP